MNGSDNGNATTAEPTTCDWGDAPTVQLFKAGRHCVSLKRPGQITVAELRGGKVGSKFQAVAR